MVKKFMRPAEALATLDLLAPLARGNSKAVPFGQNIHAARLSKSSLS
jgi:hypothetical protein